MATTATTGKKAPLLHFVTLYGLDANSNSGSSNNKGGGKESLEPRLLRCFPAPGSDPGAVLRAPPAQTGVFCFPDIDRIRARYAQQLSGAASPQPVRAEQLQQRVQDINFTLLLTDDAGRRYYGFAQRLAMPGVTAAAAAAAAAEGSAGAATATETTGAQRELPACVCIVTAHGWFQFWRLVLGWLTSRLLAYGDGGAAPGAALAAAWHDVEELVCTLLAKKDVRPGEMVSVTTGFSTRRRLSELARRPNDTLRPVGEDVAPLLKAVGVDGFVALFAALLLERRVVLVSTSMRTLSRCVFAAQDALWPFAWQHVCIPILPAAILDYLQAPMPFLIGAQHHHYLRMRTLVADAVVVDLDAGTVALGTAAAGDAALLPAAYAFHLRQKLAAAHRALASPTGVAPDDVYGACRLFLAKTVGHYERYLVRPLGCDRIAFDHDAFLASKQKPERRFWALFNESQMFRQFVAEKLDMLNSPRGVLFLTQFELDLNSAVPDDSVRYLSDTAKAQVKKFELKWKGNQTKQALKQNIRTMAAGAQQSLAKHHITSSSSSSSASSSSFSPMSSPAAPAGHAARVLRQFPRDAGRRVFPVDDPFVTDFDEIQRMFAPQQCRSASVALQGGSAGRQEGAAVAVGTLIPDEAITGAPAPRTPSPAQSPSCSDMLFAGPSPSLLDMDIAPPVQPQPLAQLAPGHRPLPQVPAMKPTDHRPPPPIPTVAPAAAPSLTVDDFLTTTPLSSSSSSYSTACTDALFSDDTFMVNTPKTSPFPVVPPRPKRDPFPTPPQTPLQTRKAADPFPQAPPQPIDTFLVPMTTNNPFTSSGGGSQATPQQQPSSSSGTVFDLF